uniref:Uncharacterized protein n=1 Tax=Anguilla anguilla TaxID=7936 RepID=A0A0E9ULT8_ANGAN
MIIHAFSKYSPRVLIHKLCCILPIACQLSGKDTVIPLT